MGGRFTRTLLGRLPWDRDYSADEQDLFLSMMQACGICFEHRAEQPERVIEAEYIAPDLLPEAPRYGAWTAEITEQREERRYAHLPGTLIRGVISAIGQGGNPQGDYWRTGVRVYETRHRSWGVVESEALDGVAGRLVIRTREGAAGELLAALVEIVAR
jgi:internalin A